MESKIDKSKISYSFSRAAKSYDAAAALQRQVADDLIDGIACDHNPQMILDLGSGTGYCSKLLRFVFPQAKIISLDLAAEMLVFDRKRCQQEGGGAAASYVRADAESLPFLADTFDLIVSSLTIQWCSNYSALFSELHRVMKKNSLAHLSTFGPETLQELKSAWKKVDSYVHVNNFISAFELEEYMREVNFTEAKIKEMDLIKYYPSLSALTKELKAIGAHNMNQGQAPGLSGRDKIIRLKNYFETGSGNEDENGSEHERNKGIPVTYALQYLKLVK